MKKGLLFGWLLLALAACSSSHEIFIEAESFSNQGGWVTDPQYMDQMGSPYLMAHGVGTSVKDAETTINVAQAGKYYVWVRTYNWNSPWDYSVC